MDWYLEHYHGTDENPGVLQMFCDPRRVGAFAVSQERLREGDPSELFRLLVTVAMFQRQRDAQVSRILVGIGHEDAAELTTVEQLHRLSSSASCSHARSLAELHERCDLYKVEGKAHCRAGPEQPCHLKRHTVLLRRYGHFGKMPTSAALVVHSEGPDGLRGLYERALREGASDPERSLLLEQALTRIWRVSDKLAAMYLSALTNPDLSQGLAPWAKGVDSSHFVVIDSNVDLFLQSIGYDGPGTYAARRQFVQSLATRIDLSALRPGLQPYNPRLVQQALYLFMSASNRRLAKHDCWRRGSSACTGCPKVLRARCSVQTLAVRAE